MKVIEYENYESYLGTLIDVQHPLDYEEFHDPRSKNIYADKLLLNPGLYLKKNETYYIMCRKGTLSRKVVRLLTFYGYDVVLVKNF